MDYKNLIIRFLSSFIFIILYLILFFYYTDKIIYLVSLIYLFIFIEVFLYFKKLLHIIFIYLLISYLSILFYFEPDFKYYEFTAIILCISCFDSFCYLFGKIFGKNKLLFKISPNKTYEGLIGGIIATNMIALFVYLNSEIYIIALSFNLFLFINLVIFFSFFGDMIQSYFKRINNLKDSSYFIPGHGGFFDRFDSFLLAIIPFSINNFIF